MTEDAGFSIDAFWVVMSALDFILLVAVVYGAIRLFQWALAMGQRNHDIEELKARILRLESSADSPAGGHDRPSDS